MVDGSFGSAFGPGPVACLVAASIWAVSVTLFARPVREFGATDVNLAKTALATVLLGGTALLTGQLGVLASAPSWAVAIVALSGLVGMSLGDTALFAAVDRIGVHRTLLLQTFAPVFAAVLSYLISDERLTGGQIVGATVTLAGVALVVGERSDRSAYRVSKPSVSKPSAPESPAPGASVTVAGLVLALCAAAGQGAGVVLAKLGMTEIGFLPASFLRLSVACAALVVAQCVRRGVREAGSTLRRGVFSAHGFRRVAPPAFLGTYVAILLMMVGISLTPAAIAAVLLGTTPIFSLFVDARVSGRPITLVALAGTLLAVAGVAVLSLG